jgi:hypothetical protein
MPDFTTLGTLHHWPRQIKPAEITLHLRSNTSSFSSPFTRTVQTTALPGALHEAEAGFAPMPPERLRGLRSFLALLDGGAGRFVFPVYPCRYAPPASGQPERSTLVPLTADDTHITADDTHITADSTRVVYETQFGVSTCPDPTTINGTLWLNSRRAPLEVDSYISWDDADGWRHLHIVVGLEHNPATGAATLSVRPPMRALPTPATPMHVHAPSGVFRLVDDGQGALRQAGRLQSFSLAMVQAFPLKVAA